MVRLSLLMIFLVLTEQQAAAQLPDPMAIARKLFGKDTVPDIANYITGEYQGQPNGSNLSPAAILDFRLLQQHTETAVVAMTITDSSGKGLDTYLHFKKDTVWKMCAFRALAMTGVIEKVKEELEQMRPDEITAMIKKSAKETKAEYKTISSMEDYNFQLGNARLMLDLDKNILAHFKQQQPLFDSLKSEALKEVTRRQKNTNDRMVLLENQAAQYKKLFISTVSYGDYETGQHCLVFLIGGMLDNAVGYLFAKDKKDIPAMTPDNVIMLIEIGDGWYLYKTT